MSLQQPIHRYSHLPYNSIRLLRLLPHQDQYAPINCQLFHCTLESSGGIRPYEALSYVWGSDHKPESISLDGCRLPIGESLFAALLHLRDRSIERILWIDAICINQEDTKEEGHQVQSMAKIYATATRVIVWLGNATPDIHQSLEVIRNAGFTAKQPTITKLNENAILVIVKAPWFQRIWVRESISSLWEGIADMMIKVLQEAAAAWHIVVKCGQAENDGYAFFVGLGVLVLPHKDYTGLRPLALTVAYLAKGAAFRSRCATSQTGRFCLDICPLAQLVDMFHARQVSDRRDKIYALLGMASDDPGSSGLLVDYDISWAKLFSQLINFILKGVSVETWDGYPIAVIKSKGCVLGLVSSVNTDIVRADKQRLGITWNSPSESEWKLSYWTLEVSAEPVKEGDVVCLLQGAMLPTIIRMHHDYWNIIVIAAAFPEYLQAPMSDKEPEIPRLSAILPHDFLLVWDWDMSLDESWRRSEYEDLMGHLAPKATKAGLQTDCEKIARFWNSGVAMRVIKRLKGEENIQKALIDLERVLRSRESQALANLFHNHKIIGGDMEELQRILDMVSKHESGLILSLAAGAGCEVVARLLIDYKLTTAYKVRL